MVDFAVAVPGCAWPVDAGRCTPERDSGSATDLARRVPILRRGARADGCGGRGIGHLRCGLDGHPGAGHVQADRAVAVGAVDVRDGGCELLEGRLCGMAVGVAAADLDA